jgi:uncharacterized OB-fold protein
MKGSQTSMEMIESVENTTIISGALSHGIQMKKCSKCGRELPITSYSKKTGAKDGLQEMCRDCKAAYMREYTSRKKQDKVEKIIVKQEEQPHALMKIYTDPELAKFTPRQLMLELKARGFRWEYMLEPQRKIYFEKI